MHISRVPHDVATLRMWLTQLLDDINGSSVVTCKVIHFLIMHWRVAQVWVLPITHVTLPSYSWQCISSTYLPSSFHIHIFTYSFLSSILSPYFSYLPSL